MSQTKKESQKKQLKTGSIMLFIVASLYMLAAFFDTTLAYESLQKSFSLLGIILPILLVILVLMTVINTYIQPKKLSQHLGKESGMRGWLIAVIAGVFSHGPGYVWYPMLSDLRTHGVKDGLIVTFFYARSIKIPWIPMMITYFGLAFTILLTLYILIGSVIQGIIADKLIRTHKNTH